ncbi:MAG: 16S rRNA (guanine(527)-N(7))-methyltransferase RsmG [Luteitalea sp.]|nr:16S rRNA (guanine(527)-N(7))-methyltransferase RsmG [Luteitalea sp.]
MAVPLAQAERAEARIERRARIVGLELDPDLCRRLASYLSLLCHWNRRINLAAFDDADKAIDRLIIEPLLAVQWVPADAASLIDIGSGGGSPAIPLRLALPRLAVVMVEARVRKAAFLREASRRLSLKDVRVERARFEDLARDPDFAGRMDLLTIRAVRVGTPQLHGLQNFLRPGGLLLWFRGQADEDRIPDVPVLQVAAEGALVPALGSRLLVLRKVNVPRGTVE